MFAIIKNGGKQYKVNKGTILLVEYIKGNIGDSVTLDDVLLLKSSSALNIGKPNVEAHVNADIVYQGRAKKISFVKFKRRKHSLTSKSHRQFYTKIKVTSIDKNN
jgi:large subunit ribosomal protein L21